jgi:hypothetical protein
MKDNEDTILSVTAVKLDNNTILMTITDDMLADILECRYPGSHYFEGNLFGVRLKDCEVVVNGYVFDDENWNSIFYASESGLSGVEVSLELFQQDPDTGSVFISDTVNVHTDVNGYFEARIEQSSYSPKYGLTITCFGPGGDYYETKPESENLGFTPGAIVCGEYSNDFGYSNK